MEVIVEVYQSFPLTVSGKKTETMHMSPPRKLRTMVRNQSARQIYNRCNSYLEGYVRQDRRISTHRLNGESSQLTVSFEGNPGPTCSKSGAKKRLISRSYNICAAHGGYETAEVRDVRRIGGGHRLCGGPGKRVDGILPG